MDLQKNCGNTNMTIYNKFPKAKFQLQRLFTFGHKVRKRLSGKSGPHTHASHTLQKGDKNKNKYPSYAREKVIERPFSLCSSPFTTHSRQTIYKLGSSAEKKKPDFHKVTRRPISLLTAPEIEEEKKETTRHNISGVGEIHQASRNSE